jgi:hypothetical protein
MEMPGASVTAADLTDPQRRALAVLAAAATHEYAGRHEPRPCRASNRTTSTAYLDHLEMLTVHHTVAGQLAAAGFVRVTNDVVGLLALTDEGHAMCKEAGL